MKKTIFVLVFMGFFLNLNSQNYTLFNSSCKKVYSEYPVIQNTYSIAFDSVVSIGNDSVYYNFCNLEDTLILPDSCYFWGAPTCNAQDRPSWVGRKIINDSSFYKFYTLNYDSLSFNFSTNTNDTFTFYSDGTQKFLMVFENTDTMTILNNIDSVRKYKILHTDLSGNSIFSALNNQNIIVSQDWGLVNFFQIDSFPQILKPLQIIGNTMPLGGLVKLTNEMLYDYQVGDEIQWHEYYYYPGFPPTNNYDNYRKYSILNRTTTVDSLIYQVERTLIYNLTSVATIDTFLLTYYRQTLISEIPFEKFNGNINNMTLKDYCGIKLWTFNSDPQEYIGYCPMDNCWGSYDTGGPALETYSTYVAGLGCYYHYAFQYLMGGGFNYGGSSIVYFKKNGIPCGSPATVGISEPPTTNSPLLLSPNPCTSQLTINNGQWTIETIYIYNVLGELVLQSEIANPKSEIILDVNTLPKGIYFVQITDEHKNSVNRKVAIQ